MESSRRNNAAAGVTGALMFNPGCFAQVLEGPLGAVEAVFERIQQDPRHASVSVIDSSPIGEPRFANWAMAVVGAEGDAAARYARSSTDSGFDLGQIPADEVTEARVRLLLEDERI